MSKVLTFKYKAFDEEIRHFALRTESIVRVTEVDSSSSRIEFRAYDTIVTQNCCESFSTVYDRWLAALKII